VPEIVVEDKRVVGNSTCLHESQDFTCDVSVSCHSNTTISFRLTFTHAPIFQLRYFECMVKHVITSIYQLIVRKVVCAEAPFADLMYNVMFTLVFHVKIAGVVSEPPSLLSRTLKSYRCW
jgi:hypothetical protein